VDVSERIAAGKAARSKSPRSSHGEWEPASDRRDPVSILEEQDRTRVPELIPIRHARMAVSPFTFYRGAAAVMAADLAATPATSLRVQLCGDAHLTNFGVFAAPDRSLIFDLNDFDESLPGPWEWDVKRLAASFEIAARDNGLKRRERESVVMTAVREYREAIRGFAAMRNLEIWYSRLGVERIMQEIEAEEGRRAIKKAKKAEAKARSKDSLRALGRLSKVVDGELRFVGDPPLVVPLDDLLEGKQREEAEAGLHGVLDAYRSTLQVDRRRLLDGYRFRDLARKVVGVGSVGTRAWIVLLTGRDDEDGLVLQAKEAEGSVLEPYAGASRFGNHGRRVVEGQRLMQAASDSFLGWCPATGVDGKERDFYVRQLWDGKGSIEVEGMAARGMEGYAHMCGWTLARAHARSGDAIAIASYLGSNDSFDCAIAEFSRIYADQNESDFAEMKEAIASGRLKAMDA
jgi:uncharacterized protein (DUF2252 family)